MPCKLASGCLGAADLPKRPEIDIENPSAAASRETTLKLDAWRGGIAYVLTPLTVIVVETLRQAGVQAPIPFLMIYGMLVISASLGGVRPAVVAAALVSAFVVYAATVPFGPATLTGGVVPVLFGCVLAFALAYFLGRNRDEVTALVSRLREREAVIKRANDALESQVRDRTAQLKDLSLRLLDVQEAERQHLARELHDEVGQTLTALNMRLHNLPESPQHGDDPSIDECLQIAGKIIDQVRGLSLDLRPPMLDDMGLAKTLRWFIRRHIDVTDMQCDLTIDLPAGRAAPSIETACFRITQEAVTNALRHAGATELSVSLTMVDARLQLEVRDNGVGFDVPGAFALARDGVSFGILGMRERVELVGGTLRFESAAGRGTKITARLPFAPATPTLPAA